MECSVAKEGVKKIRIGKLQVMHGRKSYAHKHLDKERLSRQLHVNENSRYTVNAPWENRNFREKELINQEDVEVRD